MVHVAIEPAMSSFSCLCWFNPLCCRFACPCFTPPCHITILPLLVSFDPPCCRMAHHVVLPLFVLSRGLLCCRSAFPAVAEVLKVALGVSGRGEKQVKG